MIDHIDPEAKVWGTAMHVFGSDACAVSVLEVNAGFRCSWHHHEHRINRFVVHSGEIDVITEAGRVNLKSGDVYDVPQRVKHRFEVVRGGIVIEVYWAPPVRQNDIVRADVGGPLL